MKAVVRSSQTARLPHSPVTTDSEGYTAAKVTANVSIIDVSARRRIRSRRVTKAVYILRKSFLLRPIRRPLEDFKFSHVQRSLVIQQVPL